MSLGEDSGPGRRETERQERQCEFALKLKVELNKERTVSPSFRNICIPPTPQLIELNAIDL